ncbi:MAG: zinc-ribbon domain-containing protein [Terracidiphilus sp.]
MASFCTKCGAELSPDKQVCSSCGAAAASAQPTYTQTPAAPPKSSSAVKIILIIVAIVVGLGVLGLGVAGYTVWRISRAVHMSGNGSEMTLSTPEGKVNLNTTESYTAAELGTDIYPGAQSVKGGMRMELPTGSMVTGVFVTSDSKDQVVAFYKNKFGSGASTFDTADGAILTLPMGDKESVMVTVSSRRSENDGKTKVVIVHTKNTKAS